MNKEIIRMAKEAGLVDELRNGKLVIEFQEVGDEFFRFVSLIREAERKDFEKELLLWLDFFKHHSELKDKIMEMGLV